MRLPLPTNLRTGSVSSSSIQVVWDETTPGESRFEIAHRLVRESYSTSTVSANTESFTHTGLTAGSSYQYKVSACDSAGCSAWTPEVTRTASSTS